MRQIAKPLSCILVVGRGPTLEKDDGAVALLRQLGAQVRALDLWEDFTRAIDRESLGCAEEHEGIVLVRALVFDAYRALYGFMWSVRPSKITPLVSHITMFSRRTPSRT